MDQLQNPPRPSLLKQFANFTDSTAGLEKTLRLIQALCQIVSEVTLDNALAKRCLIVKSQLALSRRYFRFLGFIPCIEGVFNILGGNISLGSILTIIELAKFSALGIYFVLEDLTILHAMNVYLVPWNEPVLIESNKFWFYGICLSILSAVVELLFLFSRPATTVTKKRANGAKENGSTKENESSETIQAQKQSQKIMPLLKGIVVDGCDLLLPGTFLGWIQADELSVSAAMVVSTIVASGAIWEAAQ
ncbi:PEX11 domain protein [Aspergillus sclerotialis]|uniref:PEX11 domain protein n=1 Tax=Aspergillus sclerotialis TaxID=2070753 RepID=A0A3A2ZM56_9EURO|nr:PEX11 domain protein [Aspergillus sclerotialis]